MSEFWSGRVLTKSCTLPKSSSKNSCVDKNNLSKTYEMLCLVCALLLAICVTFYTANNDGDHLYGLVCCISNCALWMGTLASAFFATVLHTACKNDHDVEILVSLYGPNLMRVPMMMFVWGCSMLFLEFILYFKNTVDAGFNCSLCLGACLMVIPLFFHCMHKMGWAANVLHAKNQSAAERPSSLITLHNIKAGLEAYKEEKRRMCHGNVNGSAFNDVDLTLSFDVDEFLDNFLPEYLAIGTRGSLTSVQRICATKLFDKEVQTRLLSSVDMMEVLDGSSKGGQAHSGSLAKHHQAAAETSDGATLDMSSNPLGTSTAF